MSEGHSPLGGSGAYRWMPCPGSVRESEGCEDPESEYAALGTAAHALAADCLGTGLDAWEYFGWHVGATSELFSPETKVSNLKLLGGGSYITVDKDMSDAVQVYLDAVRLEHPDRNQGNTWIERPFHCPGIHEMMWGQSDLVHLEDGVGMGVGYHRRLHVWDYKHGAGIVVYVEDNPQLMYYAVGMLEDLGLWETVDEVVLWVAQPRGFLDPIRSWTVSVTDLATWRDEVLLPAMNLAEWVLRNAPDLDHEDLLRMNLLNSGEHCRFCAARYNNCPRHVRDMEEMEELMEKIEAAGGAPKATHEQIGVFLSLFEVAKIRQKAFRETGFARAQEGHAIPGWKLVRAKSNREWKEGTEAKAKTKFKKDAMVPAKLKSPAKIEALPGGKAFAAEYAFKPDAGLQLVLDKDARQEAGPKGRAMFKPVKGGKK